MVGRGDLSTPAKASSVDRPALALRSLPRKVIAEMRWARRWFWTMVVVAAAAMGVLYRTLEAQAGRI